jgi:hypothetical protein
MMPERYEIPRRVGMAKIVGRMTMRRQDECQLGKRDAGACGDSRRVRKRRDESVLVPRVDVRVKRQGD